MGNVTVIILYHNPGNQKITVDKLCVLVEGDTWATMFKAINGMYNSMGEILSETRRFLSENGYDVDMARVHWLNIEMLNISKLPYVQMAGT